MLYLGIIGMVCSIYVYYKYRQYKKVYSIVLKKMTTQMDSVMKNKSTKDNILKSHSTTFLYGYTYRLFTLYYKKDNLNKFEEYLVKKIFINVFEHKNYFEGKLAFGYLNLINTLLEQKDKKTMACFDYGITYAELFFTDRCLSNNWKNYLLEKHF
jgi:hypothetical protein